MRGLQCSSKDLSHVLNTANIDSLHQYEVLESHKQISKRFGDIKSILQSSGYVCTPGHQEFSRLTGGSLRLWWSA